MSLMRPIARALHSARPRMASGPAWGTDVNEPGGRLFGEAIRAPGVRRKWFSWEAPFYATMGIATLMLTVGLSSRPPTSAQKWAREEALAREEKRNAEACS